MNWFSPDPGKTTRLPPGFDEALDFRPILALGHKPQMQKVRRAFTTVMPTAIVIANGNLEFAINDLPILRIIASWLRGKSIQRTPVSVVATLPRSIDSVMRVPR